jgi:hypothetical protein
MVYCSLQHLVTRKVTHSLARALRQNDTSLTMNIFADVPPLFDKGQDLYRSLQPADAVDFADDCYEAVPRYNPGVERAAMLIGRALSILRSVQA